MISRRTQAGFALVGVFVLGAIAGALAFGVFVRNEVRQAQQLRDREGFEQYFADRLRLTKPQRDSLSDELALTYEEFAMLRSAAAEEAAELLDTLDRRLSPRLTPEQRVRLQGAELHFRRGMPRMGGRRFAPMTPPPATPGPADTAPTPTNTPRPRSPQSEFPRRAMMDSLWQNPDSVAPGDALSRLATRLSNELELTDDQLAGVVGIARETQRQIRQDVAELNGMPRMQIAAAMRRLQQMDQSLMALLTDEQKRAYEPLRKQIRQRVQFEIWLNREPGMGMGMGRGGRMRGGGPKMHFSDPETSTGDGQ